MIFITASEDETGKPEIEYHLARSSGSNNNSLVGMAKAESTDRESAFIVDMEKSNGSLNNNNNGSNGGNNYHFAITGKSFNVVRDHYPDVMERLVTRGAIFARMSPDQKETLVSGLQGLGYYVAMCGDG